MPPHRLRYGLLWVALVTTLTGFAQSMISTGHSGITTYSSQDYQASTQNWAIVQDQRGVMYFANNTGVLEFDGETWRHISLGEGVADIKALAIDDSGTIYVGAENEFGYLDVSGNGKLLYHSLIPELQSDTIDFGQTWYIEIGSEGTYFLTEQTVFLWDNNTFQTWEVDGNIKASAWNNGVLYFSVEDRGLRRIKNGELNMVPGTTMLDSSFVAALLSEGADSLMLFVKGKGLMRLTSDSGDEMMVLKPVTTSLDDYLINHDVTKLTNLENGYYALKEQGTGVLFMDQNGNEAAWINESEYLSMVKAWGMYVDAAGFLWLALDNGIARLEIPPNISSFNGSGLNGTIEVIGRNYDYLYVATGVGVFYLNHEAKRENGVLKFQNDFKKVEGIDEQCWDVKTYIIDKDTITLVAGNNNIYRLVGNRAEIVKDAWPWAFHQSQNDPRRIYVGLDNGFESIYWQNGAFVAEGRIAGITEKIMFVSQDESGYLWLGIRNGGGVIRVKDGSNALQPNEVELKRYAGDEGYFDGTAMITYAGGQVLAGTDAGMFVYDPETDKFVPHPEFNELLGNMNMGVHRISTAPNGELWISGYEVGGSRRSIGVYRDGQLFTIPFEQISVEITHAMWHDENGMSWFGGPQGLFRYDGSIQKDYSLKPGVLIRKVVVNSDSLVFAGAYVNEENNVVQHQSKNQEVALVYKYNNIYFEYAAPVFTAQHAVEYSSILVGHDRDWTEWTTKSERNFTNLQEGSYEFKVKSRNIYGMESDETVYRFTVFPPWYRTGWAYAGYILAFVLFVYMAIRLSIARVKKKNERLEEIITERTREIVKQKEEIEVQKEMVEEKNKEILDSINYAQRLQEAILPPIKLIREWVGQSFVLFKPKDIVSGDFYWAKQIVDENRESVYFAAVDCTGHGVPGAMVSVVGHNGLERCIKEFGLRKPSDILDKLTELVEETFDKSESDVKDGMDLGLCCLHQNSDDSVTLEYAGANNPLYVISSRGSLEGMDTRAVESDENLWLHEIKADKQPIGKYAERKPFTNTKLELLPGETIYVFSDGYADQFGGSRGKKFKYGSFKQLLLSLTGVPMEQQEQELNKAFEEWRGELEQIDDVCVFGVRV